MDLALDVKTVVTGINKNTVVIKSNEPFRDEMVI